MQEELLNQETMRNEEVVDNTDYITAIKELKQNSVDKTKYDSLKQENKKLIKALVNGEGYEQDNVQTQKDTIDTLRKKINTPGITNLEYIDTALKLRDALIENGQEDPFVPQGSKYSPTQIDYDRANRVATILQEMVDDSEGNPDVFLNEYQRRVKDTSLDKKYKK